MAAQLFIFSFLFLLTFPTWAEGPAGAESITTRSGVQVYEAGSISPEKEKDELANYEFPTIAYADFVILPTSVQEDLLKAIWKTMTAFEKNQNQVGYEYTQYRWRSEDLLSLWLPEVVAASPQARCIFGGKFGKVIETEKKRLTCQSSAKDYCPPGKKKFACEFLGERVCISTNPKETLTERCNSKMDAIIATDSQGHVTNWIRDHEAQFTENIHDLNDYCSAVMDYAIHFAGQKKKKNFEDVEKMPRTPDESDLQYLQRRQATECSALTRTINRAIALSGKNPTKQPSTTAPSVLSLNQGLNECRSSGCCSQTPSMSVLPKTRLRISNETPHEFFAGKPKIIWDMLGQAYRNYRGGGRTDTLFDEYTKKSAGPIIEVVNDGPSIYYFMVSEANGGRVWCRIKSGGDAGGCGPKVEGRLQLSQREFVDFSRLGPEANFNFSSKEGKKNTKVTVAPDITIGRAGVSSVSGSVQDGTKPVETIPVTKMDSACASGKSKNNGAN